MLTFLSPLFLAGLLAAAIPLIIHLSRSRRTKTLRFSTTRFFTDQFLRSYRMSRLKELLLLACRMALCAVLAAALARPLLLPKGSSFVGGSRALVLVLDDSASMGLIDDGAPLLDRARGAARELIDGLRPGDTASVVLAGRRASGPEVLFPQLTPHLGDVLQAIDALRVSALGTDLSGAIARAEALARSSPAPSKEVYVLSDLQDCGWSLPVATDAPPGDVLLFVVRVSPQHAENVAVTAVQYGAARPLAGVPFSIRPHLVVQGDRTPSCTALLVVDGKTVGERRVDKMQDGRWAVPRFDHAFATGGWHTGYVEVHDPSLPLDNRRHFALEVLDTVRVLAVDGAPSQVARLDELFFLKTALTASSEGTSPIQLDVIGPTTLADSDLGPYPLVILANVGALTPPAMERLEGFVEGGGGLLVFLGNQADASFINPNLAAPTRRHGGLLPGRLMTVEGNPVGVGPVATVGPFQTGHAALAAFQDPGFARLETVGFKAYWGIDPGPTSAVLMRASTGSPLLVEKAFGKGRVLLFASTCDRDWTDFPVRPAYLPWIHRLVAYLAQTPQAGGGFFTTGEPVPLPISATEGLPQLLVKKPDGSIGHPTFRPEAEPPLAFADTTQPGVYALLAAGRPDPARLFAVNLESSESNLTYLDDVLAARNAGETRAARIEAGLRELLPGHSAITYVADPAEMVRASLASRRGRPLWDIALCLALILALGEPWLANRLSARHYARPRDSGTRDRDLPGSEDIARAGRRGRVPARPGPSAVPQEFQVP